MASVAAAILRFRYLRHAKVPSTINATNSPEHTAEIATLSLGVRLFRAPLAGEEAVVLRLVDDSESEENEDVGKIALGPKSTGVAFVTCTNAVGTARTGVQLENPRKSIRDVVALY